MTNKPASRCPITYSRAAAAAWHCRTRRRLATLTTRWQREPRFANRDLFVHRNVHLTTGARQRPARNNHTCHSCTSTAVTSVVGDASQVVYFSHEGFFSLAGVRDEDVRVGSHTHEDIRVKAKKKLLVHARATRSRVARSLLLTGLSRLYDAHPTLGSGIGRYRAPTHLIRRRARPTSPIGDDSHVRVLARCLFLYMHKYARAEGGSTCV